METNGRQNNRKNLAKLATKIPK